MKKMILLVVLGLLIGMMSCAAAAGGQQGGPPPGPPPLSPQDKQEIVQLLNMDELSFDQARAQGFSLAELAEQQGIEVQAVVDLVTKLVGSNGYRLDNDLKAGKITKEFYDEMKSHMPGAIHMTVYDKPQVQ
ncbi:MAG: hypothetical protein H6Q74_2416 [Firmicutes bacterium]|nr:hypothetical protein [Bacillota bacterium]